MAPLIVFLIGMLQCSILHWVLFLGGITQHLVHNTELYLRYIFWGHDDSVQWGLTVLHPNPLITLGLHDWDDNRHEIKSTEDWDESKTYHEPPVLYTVSL